MLFLDTTAVAPVVEEACEHVNGLDTLWVLLGAMLVFWMQPGFALVEAGMTRAKNTANILMKNFVDFMFGTVLFWILGFSIMYGAGNDFIGWEVFDKGERIGAVTGIEPIPGNLCLYIGEKLIPLHEDFIIEADPQKKELFLELPEGILSL